MGLAICVLFLTKQKTQASTNWRLSTNHFPRFKKNVSKGKQQKSESPKRMVSNVICTTLNSGELPEGGEIYLALIGETKSASWRGCVWCRRWYYSDKAKPWWGRGGRMVLMSEQMEDLRSEVETKWKIDILELKSTISEIENSLNLGLGANSSWQKNVTKVWISIETTQSEEGRAKRLRGGGEHFPLLGYRGKPSNACAVRIRR